MSTGFSADSLPAAAVRPGFLERNVAYAQVLLRSLGRSLLKRMARTRNVVDSEYNEGHWNKVLRARAWETAGSLEEFLVGNDTSLRLAKVAGEIVRIPTKDYYAYRIDALSQLLARHAGGASDLLELGSGFGYNIFSLAVRPSWGRFRGVDIAPNGIVAAQNIAQHYGLSDRCEFDRLDLTDPNDPNFSKLAGQTAFTYFCIEQIPYDVELVVEHILKAAPRRVIHIEPNAEMLNLGSVRDLAGLAYIKSVDYQTRLFTTLDRLEKEGRIKILARERMPFAPSVQNDGLLYCWEPV